MIMKSYLLLVSSGLAVAQVVSNSGVDLASLLGGNSLLNGSADIDSSAAGFDPAALGIDLNNLNVEGLDFANLDFANQDAIAQGIQGLLGNLCLNGALDFNSILGLGLNNELDLFLQLAQLQQLQQLGFLSLGGIGNLFNSGLVLGGFNLGIFKREVAKAKKVMRRTKLRRGAKVTKRQCDGLAVGNQGVAASVANEGFVTIATAPDVASVEIATAAAPSVAAATSVAAVASVPAAASTAAAIASVAPAAAPAAAPVAQPVASAAPEAVAPEAAPADGDNLADFTR